MALAETIWTDASQTQVEWISEESLRATMDPVTLEPLSGESDALSAAEAAELKVRLVNFRKVYDSGLGSRFGGGSEECPAVEDPCGGGLMPGEVAKPLAQLILERNEGFAVVVEVESEEAGWSPKWNLPVRMVSVRTVRTLWSSPNLVAIPTSFRMLVPGGWLNVGGLRICWSLKRDFFDPRPGDLVFVWGDLNPGIPGVMTEGHKLEVAGNRINSSCAFCIPEPELSLDQLQQRLQDGTRR